MPSLRFASLRRSMRIFVVVAPAVAACAALALGSRGAHAEDSAADRAETNERCANRLSIALVGKSADATLFSAADPQSSVDALLQSPAFADQLASFINSRFNGGPATDAKSDTVYWLAKYIVTNGKPWSDLFVGSYDVVANAAGDGMDVKDDPKGLGYFRTDAWRRRYAGNEAQGYMLSASFRILSNTTGLVLTPSVGQPGDDRTTTGRMAAPCNSCHFNPWYALDHVARLLPMRKGMGDTMTFTLPTEGPQQVLGETISTDQDLVTKLVGSDAWKFAQCRNVFQFLYGRNENQCEAPVFDACVSALENQKTIQSAVAAVAKDPSFCK